MRSALDERALKAAAEIVEDVKSRGLEAAREWSLRLDGLAPEKPLLDARAPSSFDATVVEAALKAAESLERLYAKALPADAVDFFEGIMRVVKWLPVDSAAVYVPARYISTLVMTAVPAKVAGVKRIYAVTPPKGATPELLALAERLGLAGVVPLGGAQGLAYAVFHLGVDLVAGPGGAYVQAAKYVLSRYVGIDGIEGPTELAVYAEGVSAEVAMKGVLAQLEHGPASFALLLSRDAGLLEKARGIYEASKTSSMGPLEVRRVGGLEEAADVINSLAPEHVEVWGAPQLVPLIRNAGAISVNSPSPLLDYVAGISHVLPTGGSARWRGALTPLAFMKPIGIAWELSASPLRRYGEVLARYEGFKHHGDALR
nr:MAG: histidinol dehydrogenase [Thermoproteus sp. AZ2]